MTVEWTNRPQINGECSLTVNDLRWKGSKGMTGWPVGVSVLEFKLTGFVSY